MIQPMKNSKQRMPSQYREVKQARREAEMARQQQRDNDRAAKYRQPD